MQADGLLVDDAAAAVDSELRVGELAGAAVAEVGRLEEQRHRSAVEVHPLLVEIAGVVEVEPEPVAARARRLRRHVPGRLRDHEERPCLQRGRRAEVGGVRAQRVRISRAGVRGRLTVGSSGSAVLSMGMLPACGISTPRTTRLARRRRIPALSRRLRWCHGQATHRRLGLALPALAR